MILIAAYLEGERVALCDALCYDADHTTCGCLCGGMNHGAGLVKALENTRNHHKEWLKAARKKHGRKVQFVFAPEVWQPFLAFPE
jgi:hypothetical protein